MRLSSKAWSFQLRESLLQLLVMRTLFFTVVFLSFLGCSVAPVDPCSPWRNANGDSIDVGLCKACVEKLGEVDERSLRGCLFDSQIKAIQEEAHSKVAE